LKEYNFIIALATDSYDFVANEVKAKLKFDYVYANNLIFKKNICTGEVKILNRDLIKDEITNKIYSISKMHILKKLCDHHGIPIKQSIAVGDGIVDCGMLTKAGIGVAIDASANVNSYADFATNNLMDILTIIKS
jgi:phosphoserine phosphatase